MALLTMPLPYTRTPHLVGLVGEVEALAARVATTDPGPTRTALWSDAAVASLRLDGSTIPGPPTPAHLRDAAAAQRSSAPTDHSWMTTLRSATAAMDPIDDTTETTILWAREYQGVMSALTADDLGDRLLRDPVDALADLHRLLTRGLVDPEVAGRPRTTAQAVHDGAVGRILFSPTAPAQVPGELHRLAGWLASAAAREHGLLVAGVLAMELLRIHPFEAANGRLARVAARLVLRARGLDPHGLAVFEIPMQTDALGIHEEVGRTTRRRDLTIWLERWGETVAAGLRHAATTLALPTGQLPPRATATITTRGHGEFTIMDYRAEAAVGPAQAKTDLDALLDSAWIVRVPGSRGLRFTTTS